MNYSSTPRERTILICSLLMVGNSLCGCAEEAPLVAPTSPPPAVAETTDGSDDGFRPPVLPESLKPRSAEPSDGFVRVGQGPLADEVPRLQRSQLDLEQITRKLALVKAIDEIRQCKRLEFMDLNVNVKIVASNAVRDKLAAILSQRGVIPDPDEPDYKVASEAYFDAGDIYIDVLGPGTLEIRRGRQALGYCHGPEIDRLCEDLVAEEKARLKTAEILWRFAK